MVIFVMVVFSILGAATVALTTTSSQMTMDEQISQQAFSVADAGISFMAKTLSADPDWSDNAGVTKPFGPGRFTISYVAKSQTSATIRSSGTVGGITRSVEQSFTKDTPPPAAFSTALYVEKSITASGESEGTINGNAVIGDKSTTSGGAHLYYNGDVSLHDQDASVPLPDWSYWQGQASHVISGDWSVPAGTYNGIYYVTGKVNINSADVTFNGTIVSRAEVNITGGSSATIRSSASNPAIIAGTKLTISSSDASISGHVVSISKLTVSGGTSDVTIDGGIAAGYNVEFSGGSRVEVNFVSPGAQIPGFIGGERDAGGTSYVIFNTWKEVS